MYLALQYHFHLPHCMWAGRPGLGLTNRSQISASRVPQGASLELILASPSPECCLDVQSFTWTHMGECTHSGHACAAYHFSYAARLSKNTRTSFVSLESNNQSVGHRGIFLLCKSQGNFKLSGIRTLTPCSPWGPLGPAGQLRGHCC